MALLVDLDWDVEIYSQQLTTGVTGMNETTETDLINRFPGIEAEQPVGISGNATTIVDCMGRILVWVLPNILEPRYQVNTN